MKILHLISYPIWSGPVEPTVGLILGQRRAGHQVDLIWDDYRKDIKYEEKISVRLKELGFILPFPLVLSTKASLWQNFQAYALLRKIKKEYDVIHCHMSHDHTLIALMYGMPGAKLIRTLHSARSFKLRLGQKWLLQKSDGVIVRSIKHAEYLQKYFNQPTCKLICIKNGYDASLWQKHNEHKPIPLPQGVTVAFVSMIQKGRGHVELLKAWKEVVSKVPQAHLQIIGEGELQQQLIQLCHDLGIQSHVSFMGYLPQAALYQLYSELDYLYIDTTGNDIGCRTVLEAFSHKLPVIAVKQLHDKDVSRFAINDAVTESQAGYLVDKEMLAEQIIDILHKEYHVHMKEKAFTYVNQKRTIQEEVSETISFYEMVIRSQF